MKVNMYTDDFQDFFAQSDARCKAAIRACQTNAVGTRKTASCASSAAAPHCHYSGPTLCGIGDSGRRAD